MLTGHGLSVAGELQTVRVKVIWFEAEEEAAGDKDIANVLPLSWQMRLLQPKEFTGI